MGPRLLIAYAAVIALLVSGCSGNGTIPDGGSGAGTDAGATEHAPRRGGWLNKVNGPLVTAVGDIVCAPGSRITSRTCRHAATARQARGYQPRLALVLGDNQYDTGSLRAYRRAYDRTWGRLKGITKPVPGNHEYRTNGASGYFRYFQDQQPGPPGYYAVNLGRWRLYALNSNCSEISCSREARWLDRNMARQPRECSAIVMHHPRYSSGPHGDNAEVSRFWRVALAHRVEFALAGHDHDYERFQPMNANGAVTRRGVRSFVVGTGGKSPYRMSGIRHGSVVFDNHRAGVLALRLGRHRYAWRYRTIDGREVDSGIGRCRT